jgi:molybdopterin-guanine dinucleotide biosynthesis protein A
MPATTSTNGFVLAGGQSRRMRRDKAALPWGAGSLLDHMIQLLSTVAGRVRVVGRGELPDNVPGKGPLGGILTALEHTDRDENLILAVDLPLLTPDFLEWFHSRFQVCSKPLLACHIAGTFPLCLGIRRYVVEDLRRRLAAGKLAVREFIEESDPELLEEKELVDLGFAPSIFRNVNTPEDWKKVLSSES